MYGAEDYVAWADELADFMGPAWLSDHEARPYQEPHVLAAWLQQYKNTSPESIPTSQPLLQIGELMCNIHALRNAGTQNLESRLDDLRMDDRERVLSAIHEIRVAAEYVYAGRRAFFIPEAGVQTPDLLIDDGMEVECKCKNGISPQDKARFELYGILNRKLRDIFPVHVPHEALILEVMFHIEPRRDLVDYIVSAARTGLRRTQPSTFIEQKSGLFTAHFEVLGVGTGPMEFILPRGESEFDQRSIEGIVIDAANRTLGRFIRLDVGCEVRQDRVKGVLKSIRSAARQFSGRYPAIVSVDISSIAAKSEGEALAHLTEDVLAVLKNHTTISRVELSTTQFIGDFGEQSYYTSIQQIDNPDARFPIVVK